MAEWLVEAGIAEERALLIEGGTVLAARLRWPGGLEAGLVDDAVLISKAAAAKRGTARFSNGAEVLVSSLAPSASEGAVLRVKITRAAIAETGRHKLPHASPSNAAPCPAPSLCEAVGGKLVRAFPAGLWEDVFADAWAGSIAFAGGSLTISPTPAMTLIDIDGHLPPRELALAAVPAIGAAIRRLDLGGSIGIDFPTLPHKADRAAVDHALGALLNDWPHERTAMNGFGLVQIVARLERPSLQMLLAQNRTGATARLLLRQAERLTEPGSMMVIAPTPVLAAIKPDWRHALAQRCGCQISWHNDDTLALEGGYAQKVI